MGLWATLFGKKKVAPPAVEKPVQIKQEPRTRIHKTREVKLPTGHKVSMGGDLRDPQHPLEVDSSEVKMIGGRASHVFSEKEKLRICEMLAQFHTSDHIVQYARDNWGKSVTPGSIYAYRESPRWKPVIDRFRTEYVGQVMDIPIAHKKVRLARLEGLYQDNLKDQEVSSKEQRQLSVLILERAMKEVDERASNFTNIFFAQIQNFSDEELETHRKKLLDRIKTIDIGSESLDKDAPDVLLNDGYNKEDSHEQAQLAPVQGTQEIDGQLSQSKGN